MTEMTPDIEDDEVDLVEDTDGDPVADDTDDPEFDHGEGEDA